MAHLSYVAKSTGSTILCQWKSPTVSLPKLAEHAYVCAGAAIHKLFHRNWWEVERQKIGQGKKWARFTVGGGYAPFYKDNERVVLWENDGQRVKEYTLERYPYLGNNPSLRIQNPSRYFQPGLTYGVRTERFSIQSLDHGHIFSDKGQAVFPNQKNDHWFLLGYLNAWLVNYYLSLICDLHKNYSYVRLIPISYDPQIAPKISDWAKQAWGLLAAWDTGNEICIRFTKPWLLHISELANQQSDEVGMGIAQVLELLGKAAPEVALPIPPTLDALLAAARAIESAADGKLQQLQAQIDEAVYDLYEISPDDRTLIERELGDRPPSLIWSQMGGKSDQEKRREHVRRLLSYFILQAIKADQDGILPLVEHTGESIALDRLRERLETTFGPDVAFQLEDDAGRVLGKSVDKWLDKPFIQWHTKVYKRRPIIWHIASPQGTFGALVYYHKLDRDTLPKVRNVYLRTLRDWLGVQLEQARSDENHKAVDRLETALDDLAVLDDRLGRVIEAGYDPVIDDGVKANILPLQEAEVLRHRKVV